MKYLIEESDKDALANYIIQNMGHRPFEEINRILLLLNSLKPAEEKKKSGKKSEAS